MPTSSPNIKHPPNKAAADQSRSGSTPGKHHHVTWKPLLEEAVHQFVPVLKHDQSLYAQRPPARLIRGILPGPPKLQAEGKVLMFASLPLTFIPEQHHNISQIWCLFPGKLPTKIKTKGPRTAQLPSTPDRAPPTSHISLCWGHLAKPNSRWVDYRLGDLGGLQYILLYKQQQQQQQQQLHMALFIKQMQLPLGFINLSGR